MCTNLYFCQAVIQAEHRCMQRLVSIDLGCSDKVFNAPILGTPQGMNMTKCQVAIMHSIDQNTEGYEVMDLAQFSATLLQLTIDACKMLLPGMNFRVNVRLLHFILQGLADLIGIGLALAQFVFH